MAHSNLAKSVGDKLTAAEVNRLLTADGSGDFSVTGNSLTIDNLKFLGNAMESLSGDVDIKAVAGSAVVLDSNFSFDGSELTALLDANTIFTAYTGKNITIEDVTFDGGALAGITSINMSGNLTVGGTVDGIDIAGTEVPAKAIGNIHTPMTELDLQNTLNLKQGAGSVTFTRSTVKNYVDRYGVVQEAAVDTPAFEKEGCLLEGASTNLLLQSEDFATTWALTRAGLTANAETAPDGTATAADKLKQTVTASSKYVSQTLVDDSTADYTFSVFAKKGEVESVRIIVADSAGQTNRFEGTFNLATGVVTSSTEVGTGAITAAVIKELANDWYRISISGTPSTVDTNEVGCTIELSGEDDSNTTDGLYIWGAQVEELPYTSSYIITTTAAVTRTADVCSIVRAENKPDSLDDFTVIADINMIGTKGVYTAVLTSGDLQLRVSESIINDGSTRIYMGAGMVTPPIIKTGSFRFGVTYSNPSLKMFHDGVLVSETSSATASDAGTANITIGEADAFSHISNLRIHNKALTDNEMRIA